MWSDGGGSGHHLPGAVSLAVRTDRRRPEMHNHGVGIIGFVLFCVKEKYILVFVLTFAAQPWKCLMFVEIRKTQYKYF